MGDADPHGAGFSLELGDDLIEMRDWLHEFAASVIRPAAAEWDEREETPWPVLEEAAKIGLYSLDFYAQQHLEASGLGIPVAFEELFWGDAGIGISLVLALIAASTFLTDWYQIDALIASGAEESYNWYGAFSLLLSFVWLYLEMLRLLSKVRR